MAQEHAASIAALTAKLQRQEREARETKRAINQLAELDGLGIPFPDANEEGEGVLSLGGFKRDEFYGVPLATAIRKFLEMRKRSGMGPATVNDLYSALAAGGFVFDTKNEANAKRGLYISLAKNAVVFHKLPGGTNEAAVFGLTEWYPNARTPEEPKKKSKAKAKAKALPKSTSADTNESGEEKAKPVLRLPAPRRGPVTIKLSPKPRAGDQKEGGSDD